MATKAQAYAAIKKHNATIELLNDSMLMDAPQGKVFNADKLHCYVYDLDLGPMSEVWQDVCSTLSYGTSDCTLTACDYCITD